MEFVVGCSGALWNVCGHFLSFCIVFGWVGGVFSLMFHVSTFSGCVNHLWTLITIVRLEFD